MARRSSAGGAFNNVEVVATLSSSALDFPLDLPLIKCTLYFGSNRPGTGGYDIYVARRGN